MLDRRDLVTSAATSLFIRPVFAAAAPAERMTRGYAAGPFGQIHYRCANEGQPLVMIHQAANSSRQFERVYPLFTANGFRPIGIDLPGYGDSDPTTFAPKVEDWTKIVAPVLDALHIGQADILGHHTGATVATEFAVQNPKRARKLVIHGAFVITPEERAQRLSDVEKSKTREGVDYKADGSHLSSAFVSRGKMYGPSPDPEAVTRYVIDRYLVQGPQWYGMYAVWTYDHEAALKRVRQPTLLITNDGDQIYELTRRAHTLRSDFAYVELHGGTVDVQDQMPQQWADAITKFLKT